MRALHCEAAVTMASLRSRCDDGVIRLGRTTLGRPATEPSGVTRGLAGLGVGALVSVAVVRSIRTLLFEVLPGDPATLATALILVAGAGLLACSIPASRATRVDPLAALRHE
jgi:putative ABC transport system permease protein